MTWESVRLVAGNCRWGWICLAVSDRSVCCVTLPCSSRREAEKQCRRSVHVTRAITFEEPTLQDRSYLKQIVEYVDEKRMRFSVPLDLQGFSPFVRRVWKTAQQVPFGQTRSYAWIAARLGNPGAYRAVGNALGKNPVPIVVPCHRIVRSNGTLGGFSAGLAWKKRLLAHEGVVL